MVLTSVILKTLNTDIKYIRLDNHSLFSKYKVEVVMIVHINKSHS